MTTIDPIIEAELAQQQAHRLRKGDVWFVKFPPTGIDGGNGVHHIRLIDVRTNVVKLSLMSGIGSAWRAIRDVEWLERDETASSDEVPDDNQT